MNRTRKPTKLTIGPVKARVVRGPHRDDPGRWYWRAVVYRGANSEEVTLWTGWATRGEAEQVCARLVQEGALTPSENDIEAMRTVRDLLECWVATQLDRVDLKAHGKRNYRQAGLHLVKTSGPTPIDSVGPELLERHRDRRMRRGAAASTVKQELKVLRAAWEWGRRMGVVPDRPLGTVKLKTPPVRNHHTPDAGDVWKVLDLLEGWPKMAVRLIYATGARVGEIAVLRWRDVDLSRKTLQLRGKTGVRLIPMSTELVGAFSAWPTGDADDFVLGVSENMVRSHLNTRYLVEACAQANVPRFTPHGLRRAAVDALLRAGVDVGTAAAILGHSPQVMLKYYRRATMDDQRKALEAAKLGSIPRTGRLNIRALSGHGVGQKPAQKTRTTPGGINEKAPRTLRSEGQMVLPTGVEPVSPP